MDEKTRDDLLDLFRSKLNEAMRFYLETCTRCGVCTEACHVHASMGQGFIWRPARVAGFAPRPATCMHPWDR
jgi:ferredoxin